MSNEKSVVVTVTDEALKNIKAVAQKLRAKGMKVDRVLPITGVITGSCSEAKKALLGQVTGVNSVEDEAEVQLAPPDSEVQ